MSNYKDIISLQNKGGITIRHEFVLTKALVQINCMVTFQNVGLVAIGLVNGGRTKTEWDYANAKYEDSDESK